MKNLKQLEGMIEKFEAIKEEFSVEQGQLDNTLAGLKQELPGLLLGHELDEITPKEVSTVRTEIVKVQERLTDIPSIIEAIEGRERQVQEDMRRVRKKSDLQEGKGKYIELIAKVKDTTLEYSRALDSEIRSTANPIGKDIEADEIIGNWKNRLTQTPVGKL